MSDTRYYVAVNNKWEEVTVIRKYFYGSFFYHIMSNSLILPDNLLISEEQSKQRNAEHWTPIFSSCKKYNSKRENYFKCRD